MSRTLAAILLSSTLLLAGCTQAVAPAPVAPNAAATMPNPTESAAKPQGPREQALALMQKGDYAGAIERWQALIAQQPTADNWNDLSYTYLLTKRWPDAAAAAKKALDLQKDHPGAQYNLGLAHLEQRNYREATFYLQASATAQPDRYEPWLALSRVYTATLQQALAAYTLSQAQRLAPDSADVKLQADRVAPLYDPVVSAPPANLLTACRAKLTDGPLTLCLYPRPTGQPGERAVYDVYLIKPPQAPQRLSLGTPAPGDFAWQKAPLPGGGTGYWLQGALSGAYVSGAVEWRLFTFNGNRLVQTVFTGATDAFMDGFATDYLRSSGPPEVRGNDLLAAHGRDSSRGKTELITWRLAADRQTAAQQSLVETDVK